MRSSDMEAEWGGGSGAARRPPHPARRPRIKSGAGSLPQGARGFRKTESKEGAFSPGRLRAPSGKGCFLRSSVRRREKKSRQPGSRRTQYGRRSGRVFLRLWFDVRSIRWDLPFPAPKGRQNAAVRETPAGFRLKDAISEDRFRDGVEVGARQGGMEDFPGAGGGAAARRLPIGRMVRAGEWKYGIGPRTGRLT